MDCETPLEESLCAYDDLIHMKTACRRKAGSDEPEVAERARRFQAGVRQLKDMAEQLGKTPAQVSLNRIMNRLAVSSAIMFVSQIEQ